MKIFRKFRSNKRAVTNIEAALLVLVLIAIVVPIGALSYVIGTGVMGVPAKMDQLAGTTAELATAEKDLADALADLATTLGVYGDRIAAIENRLASIEQSTKPIEQTLVIGGVTELSTMDPAWGNAYWDCLVSHVVREPLLNYQAYPLELVPCLATEYNFSSDYLTCTLKLRQNVKFSNGMPFNASAVKYSFERTIAQGGIGKTYLGPINYSNPVTIVDDYTINLNLVKAMPAIYPNFLAIMAGGSIIYPGANDTAAFEIGTGPFRITTYNKGQFTILERNENYWGRKPKLQKVILREYKEPTSLKLALESHEVDIAMHTDWNAAEIKSLENNPYLVSKTSFLGRFRFFFMNQKFPPLNNTLVRQAIAYAVDKDRLLQVGFKGDGEIANSACPSYFDQYYLASWEKYYPTNKTKARELLVAAGYPDGFTTELWYSVQLHPQDRDVALLIQDDLAQIGIQVEVKTEEYTAFKKRRFNPGIPMALQAFIPDYPDPASQLQDLLCTYGFFPQIMTYNNSQVDALGMLAAAEFNETKRMEYYIEMQSIAAEDIPFVPIKESLTRAYHWPNVKNFNLPTGTMHQEGAILMDVYIGAPY